MGVEQLAIRFNQETQTLERGVGTCRRDHAVGPPFNGRVWLEEGAINPKWDRFDPRTIDTELFCNVGSSAFRGRYNRVEPPRDSDLHPMKRVPAPDQQPPAKTGLRFECQTPVLCDRVVNHGDERQAEACLYA